MEGRVGGWLKVEERKKVINWTSKRLCEQQHFACVLSFCPRIQTHPSFPFSFCSFFLCVIVHPPMCVSLFFFFDVPGIPPVTPPHAHHL